MTALRSLFERRGLEDPAKPLTDASLIEVLGGFPVDAGVPVSPLSSLTMSAVWRSVSVISGLGGALPLHAFEPLPDRGSQQVTEPLLEQPNPELTKLEFLRLTYVHRCLWGNAFVQKIRGRTRSGAPGPVRELWPIRPHRVRQWERRAGPDGRPLPKRFDVVDDSGRVHVGLSEFDILHMPHISVDGTSGLSPVAHARQAVGLALAAEKSGARFFARGSQLGGVLQTDQNLEQGDADQLKAQWRSKMAGIDNAHEIAVLDAGAKFQPITMPLKDAQYLESRRFTVFEIGRFFGLPPFLQMETERSTSWGTALEQQQLAFLIFDLRPAWLAPTEQRITKELLFRPRFAKYAVEGILRADSKARADFYRVMREIGAFSANDIRELEDRPPVEGGDTYIQPLNFGPLGSTPASRDDDDDGPPPGDDQDDDEDGDEDE